MTEVRAADTEAAYEDALSVRYRVFVDEQGVDPDLEVDDHEDAATHFVAYEGGEPVGAARLRAKETGDGEPTEGRTASETAKIERVAVIESHREQGIGRELMDAAEAEARRQGFAEARLHSQTRAAGFYERLGYEQVSEEFEEAGIPHVAMRKPL
jgi:predicted GNAT family N-acyltransferase